MIPATSAPTCTRRQMDPNPTSSTSRACAARWTTPSRTEHSTLTMRIFVAELTTTACPVSGRCFWLLFSAARSRLDPWRSLVAHRRAFAAEWTNTYEYGVAIQTWGATPPCQTPPSCKNHNGSAACCTADCQVLGTGAPKWSLIDPANPATGGVQARYRAGASKSGPFVCKFNPATGTQYEREVTFRFLCDPEVKGVETLSALQNATDDCRYSLLFKTSKACAGDSHLRFVSRAKGRLAGLFV